MKKTVTRPECIWREHVQDEDRSKISEKVRDPSEFR